MIDFKFSGCYYTVCLEESENIFEYSPFFPYDLSEIIYPLFANYIITNTGLPEKSSYLTTSNDYNNTNPNYFYNYHPYVGEFFDPLINILSPFFIRNGFKFWKNFRFIDKIEQIYDKHKDIFNYKFTYIKSDEIIHSVFPNTVEGYKCSIPLTFFLSLIHDDKCKQYFLDDLLKFSDAKIIYIFNKLYESFNLYKEHNKSVCGVYEVIKKNGKNIENIDICDLYFNILKKAPKSLDKSPLKILCHVPTLPEYPKSSFQWYLVNAVIEKFYEKHIHENKTKLKTFLPYIRASEHVVEIYNNYLKQNNIRMISSNHPYERYQITDMLNFITDGHELYNRYKDNEINIKGKILKMKQIKGTFINQMKNSVFNHNLDKSISIESKMLLIKKDEPMYIDIKLSDVLEEHRIKSKTEMIFLGKELGHCIGSKVDSKNLFFRFDTICAEVDVNNKKIIQCYDRNDNRNENCELFELFLCDEFEKIGIILESGVQRNVVYDDDGEYIDEGQVVNINNCSFDNTSFVCETKNTYKYNVIEIAGKIFENGIWSNNFKISKNTTAMHYYSTGTVGINFNNCEIINN